MATVVQCTNCGKKLKLKTPAPGKKLRCPGCKEPFVLPKGGPKQSGPKKKKRRAPAPVDEFDDFGDDYGDDMGDDDFGEAPTPKKKKKGGKKKSSSSEKKSKAPLFIGVGVLGVALAGSLVYFLLPDGDGESSTETAAADTGDADPDAGVDADDEHAGEDVSDEEAMMMASTGADAEHGGAGSEHGGPPPSVAPTGTPSSAADGSLNLTYLPAKAEGAVKFDIARLMEGPLGALLQQPQIAAQVEGFRGATGLGPENIESITVGVGDISSLITSGNEPSLTNLPFTAVLRTNSSVDLSRLQPFVPGAEVVSGTAPMLRLPAKNSGEPAGLLWQADNQTLVIGAEPAVNAAMQTPNAQTSIDTSLLTANSPIQILFSPANPDAIFRHPKAKVPQNPAAPAAGMKVAEDFLANAQAAGIGIDLTNDLGFNMAIRCKDEQAAQQMVESLKAAQEESKEQQAQQPPNMMMLPFMNIQKQLEETQVIEAQGNVCRTSSSAKGGGAQIANLVPMAAGFLMTGIQNGMQGMGPGGFGGPPQDPLRNIALAMHNFHDIYGRFPNAASKSEDGTPLLSWRVHILPFLGYEDLYDEFNLEEAWNSEHNQALVDQMPEIFASPDVADPSRTVMFVPTGAGTAFEDSAGRSMPDFTDGTSNTILIIQAPPESAVIWTQPVDYSGDGADLPDNVRAALVDGSTHDVPTASVKPMLTRNGGEVIQQ